LVNGFLQLAKTMLKSAVKFIFYPILVSGLILGLFGNTDTTNTSYTSSHTSALKEKTFNYNFAVKDRQGNKISFEEFRGKVLFINLWATWCGPCRSEMPTIQQLYNAYAGNEQIKFVMLSLDTEKTAGKIDGYIKTSAYSFPVYSPSGYLPELFQVPSIPVTFIISKQGKVLVQEVGATNFNTPKYKTLLEEEAEK
jgi:thiol-disulfide isomerase/thioredoxin